MVQWAASGREHGKQVECARLSLISRELDFIYSNEIIRWQKVAQNKGKLILKGTTNAHTHVSTVGAMLHKPFVCLAFIVVASRTATTERVCTCHENTIGYK